MRGGGNMPDPGIPSPAPQTVASVKSGPLPAQLAEQGMSVLAKLVFFSLFRKMNWLGGMAMSISTAIKIENVRLDDILTSHADRLRELEADDPPLEPCPAFTFTEGGSSMIEKETRKRPWCESLCF
ncbi:hypothetical protein B0H14DRAFT_2615726 [Mycena olivaceomarginata]|nr:hypothetical protein B0H14DRAFT_2615726 [Mycena olivaceomarginata]